MGKPCMCVLRNRQPGLQSSGLFCVALLRTRGCTPCDACASILTFIISAIIIAKTYRELNTEGVQNA